VNSLYHDAEIIEWLTSHASRMMADLDEMQAELAARTRGCSCRWEPDPGLMPNPECPAHGVETTDLLTLGRAARDAALQVLTTGQVTR